jgi:hypothetical protein
VSTKLFELLTAHMKENCPNCCVEKLINSLNLEVDLAIPQLTGKQTPQVESRRITYD